jgi:hypothetical protein
MIVYDQNSPEFERQTAVMMALPHAVHPMHGGNWRTMADELIKGLEHQSSFGVFPLCGATGLNGEDACTRPVDDRSEDLCRQHYERENQ